MKRYTNIVTINFLRRNSFNNIISMEDAEKSKYILAILSNIPLQNIILEEMNDGTYSVLYGHKLVSSIVSFLKGEFAITPCDGFPPDLVGSYFNNLNMDDRSNFLENGITIDVCYNITDNDKLLIMAFYKKKVAKIKEIGEIKETEDVKEVKEIAKIKEIKEVAAKAENKKKHLFTCKDCGYQSNDDRIGAMNLYRMGTNHLIDRKAEKEEVQIDDQVEEKDISNKLHNLLNKFFFSNVNIKRPLTNDIIFLMLMVSDSGVNFNLSSKNIAAFEKELKFLPEDLEPTIDYMGEAYFENTDYLKKTHLPMIYLCAKKAMENNVSPERFKEILDSFFESNNQHYKKASDDGTSSKSQVNKRIEIMTKYFNKQI